MKLRSILSLAAAVVLSVAPAMNAQQSQPTGKIHGKVSDPTGMIKTNGSVSLSTDGGKTSKYTFPVNETGQYIGDGIAVGTYTVVYRQPDTPEGKFVDKADNVKIVADQDVLQDFDMSRQAFLDQLTPDQRKQVEEFKKKNADIMKNNSEIKNLNADLTTARTDNHDKKYDEAEALMLKDTAAKPDVDLLWYELGFAQLGLKKWDDASASFKKAADLNAASKKPSPDLIGGAQAGMGEALARSGKAADAQAAYDLAAKSNPPKAGFYYSNETIVFFQLQNNPEAQAAAADKAIAADPNNATAYYLKGQALIGKATVDQKSGKIVLPPGCEEAYNKYLELAPNGPYANDVKGILQQSQTTITNTYNAKKKKS